MTNDREPAHKRACHNPALVCHPVIDTGYLNWEGRRIMQRWEECISCGATTPTRVEIESGEVSSQ
jgi:hypothetical protein